MAKPSYLLVGGCPAPYIVAPYIYIVAKDAGLLDDIASIYRGQDKVATPLLHLHGHHTQKELCDASPAQRAAWGVTGTPNPFGHSEHELFDNAGRPIPAWAVGWDIGPNTNVNREHVIAAGHHRGLKIHFPYNALVEYHHAQFEEEPKADGKHLTKTRVVMTRQMLVVQTRVAMRGHW